MKRKVVTKQRWLAVGLTRFGELGLAGLKVEAMARSLGSSKAGFYWYFKSRAAFELALFEHWRTIETRRIIAVAEAARDPLHKLLALFTEVIHLRGGGDFLFHLRRLARKRSSLARLLEQTETERLQYMANVLVELGANPDTAAVTAEAVYHLYLGWYERHRFEPTSPAEARKQLRIVGTLIGVDLRDARSTTMKHEHLERPWRVHQLAADFTLADIWRFELGPADDRRFDAFLADFWAVLGTLEHSMLARARVWLGAKLGWDTAPPLAIPGCTERSIAERLTTEDTAANRNAPSAPSPLPAAGVTPIYRFADEALYEISNRTIHALLHLSWVAGPNGRTGVLAVYVKHRGVPSRVYMAAIWPARHFIIYPSLIARLERRWARHHHAAA